MSTELSDLFPLPCTPFERFMLLDDRPSHPMVCTVEMTLDGNLDEDLLRAALADVLPRHPLLSSQIAFGRRGWPQWVLTDIPPAIVTEQVPGSVDRDFDEPFDLTRMSGLRVCLRPGVNGAQLLVQFHHACADGAGIFTFLFEWLAVYGRKQNSGMVPEPLPPADFSLLRERTRPGAVPHSRPWRERLRALLRGIRIAVASARPLAETGSAGSAADSSTTTDSTTTGGAARASKTRAGTSAAAFQETQLTRQELDALRSSVRRAEVSLNDWLLAALIRTCADWNARHQPGFRDGQSRIMVPVDLRQRADAAATAANHVSYKFISRRSVAQTGWQELLDSISEEMTRVRKHRTVVYLRWLRWLFRVPPVARHVIGRESCTATAVLSNLGQLTAKFGNLLPSVDDRFHVGELVVSDIRVAPPKRPLTRLAIVTLRYANEFRVLARDDSQPLNGEALEQILNQFQSAILEPLQTETERSEDSDPEPVSSFSSTQLP